MDWLANLLGGEDGNAIQLLTIIAGAIILLVFIFWLFKKIAGKSSSRPAKSDEERLSITVSARVDETRYLVLVKRDNVEHLVMIGGPTDIVIESGIGTSGSFEETASSIAADSKKQEPGEEPRLVAVDKIEPATNAGVSLAAVAGTAVASSASETAAEKEATVAAAEENTDIHIPDLEESISAGLDEDLSTQATETAEQETGAKLEPVVASSAAPAAESQPANLEAEISEKLDTVLSDETLDVSSANDIKEDMSEIPPVTKAQSADEIKSEMQKLLDEVAGIRRTS